MEIKRVNKDEIKRKTKAFFQSKKWKNLLVFLVFVVLAFCFWMLQYFQQKIEREITIPIHYTHIPKEIVLGDSLPEKITLKLFDKGTVFLRYYFDKDFTSIDVDLRDIPTNKTSYSVKTSDLLFKIQNILLKTTQIISYTPDNLIVKYFPLEKKELPVVIAGKMTTAAGYMFTDTLKIDPAAVWVYGDKSVLDTLTFIKTVLTMQENIQESIDFTLRLKTPKGTHLSDRKVKVTGDVEEYTEKKFELPIVCYNVPDNLYVRFFPSSVEVICQVVLSKYSQLEETDLKVSVDYSGLSQNQSMIMITSLYDKPQWLVNYRIIPETVEYLIEQKRDL